LGRKLLLTEIYRFLVLCVGRKIFVFRWGDWRVTETWLLLVTLLDDWCTLRPAFLISLFDVGKSVHHNTIQIN